MPLDLNPRHYSRGHHDPRNLVIHLLTVPVFWLGTLVLLYASRVGDLPTGIAGMALMGLSMGLQGIGHKREQSPPELFDGPVDFIARILVEQFYRFPRFVLGGEWWRNLKGSIDK